MEKLCRVKVKDGMIRQVYSISNIDGIVKESTLATEDSTSYPMSQRGLVLRLDGREERFVLPHAGFRVDVGERVIIYADSLSYDHEMAIRGAVGLQVLNEEGRVAFQYKDGGNLEFMERVI